MGVALSAALHRALPSLLPAGFPRADEIAIDGRVLAFAAIVAAVASVAAGILPVLQSRRLDLTRALSDGSLASAGAGRGSLAMVRLLIVGSQVAVTSVLVIGAVLLDAQLPGAHIRRSRLRRHECLDGHRAVSRRLFVRATATNTPAHARTPAGAAGNHARRLQHRRAAGVGRRIQLVRLRHADRRCGDSSRGDSAPGDAGLLRRVGRADPCRSSADRRGYARRTDGGGRESIVRPQVSRRYADRAGDRAVAGDPGGSGHEARQERRQRSSVWSTISARTRLKRRISRRCSSTWRN